MTGLRVESLSKSFGGIAVARSLTLELPPGSRTALIGPNGAGKTTFANLITGTLKPSSGRITLDGADIGALSQAERAKAGIAKTFQITNLFKDLTVRENLRISLLEREGRTGNFVTHSCAVPAIEEEIEENLAQFNLLPMADRRVADLAYGQQRLIDMALALALRPRVLILDEPAAGVPSGESHLIVSVIKRLPASLSVLIIEHDMKLVFEVSHRIIVLVAGAILVEGTPEEISRNASVRELYLGARHG
ncbi:MAG: ABC transporter ATP-binding protein [Proteobacteria bacterium]|nr:ABC transporter ATP-binding protein [Pseudomonadota bacterium]MBI3497287.1 ABC transporter ATP-binding protein [Pseudomonadota bacterium]